MKQKGFTPVYILIGILILIALGGGYYLSVKNNLVPLKPATSVNNSRKACTEEAKKCPDGSFVARTGSNCEFSSCPASSSAKPADETANWKTYANGIFEFKYPSNFTLQENIKESIYLSGDDHISLSVSKRSEVDTSYFEKNAQRITINGIEGLKESHYGSPSGKEYITWVYFFKGDYTYFFDITFYKEGEHKNNYKDTGS